MFKVGDRVTVKEYSSERYIGLNGFVTNINNSIYPIRVYLFGEGFHSFSPQQLTPYNKNNKSEELQNTQRYKTNSGKQLFDVLEDDLLTYEELRGFYKANIYKYTHRYKEKNGIEDLKKVKVYVDQLIKLEEKQDEI